MEPAVSPGVVPATPVPVARFCVSPGPVALSARTTFAAHPTRIAVALRARFVARTGCAGPPAPARVEALVQPAKPSARTALVESFARMAAAGQLVSRTRLVPSAKPCAGMVLVASSARTTRAGRPAPALFAPTARNSARTMFVARLTRIVVVVRVRSVARTAYAGPLALVKPLASPARRFARMEPVEWSARTMFAARPTRIVVVLLARSVAWTALASPLAPVLVPPAKRVAWTAFAAPPVCLAPPTKSSAMTTFAIQRTRIVVVVRVRSGARTALAWPLAPARVPAPLAKPFARTTFAALPAPVLLFAQPAKCLARMARVALSVRTTFAARLTPIAAAPAARNGARMAPVWPPALARRAALARPV